MCLNVLNETRTLNSIRTTSNTEQLGSRREARTNQKLQNTVLPAVLTYTVNKHDVKDNYRTTGCETLFFFYKIR